ncbi:MAG: hypothetical protein methR_P0840 [Methyloprofundus sp.]|nr:MAG: hypothetical protein methR_P0840 [Methyloprofundus sp.]
MNFYPLPLKNMLEITGKEISELTDVDLRSLIGLLCEAELRINKLPTAGVTWGGHQNAKDGGIDVRVDISISLPPDNFIPRGMTGFQVKKPDMPRAAIIKEMQQAGKLIPIIQELANSNGAYIIISSAGSTSASALINRNNAMREALTDCSKASSLKTDFYDRERIASWVRSHPSLILWVREKLGNPIQGWQPYANWANVRGDTEEEYLLDEKIRINNGGDTKTDGLSVVDGINCLHSLLHNPKSSVRLVGLSGVGKECGLNNTRNQPPIIFGNNQWIGYPI